MKPIDSFLRAAALVPGLPHLLMPEMNQSYKDLAQAMSALGDQFEKLGVERILYYSTQWISVLGQLFQAREHLHGVHTDENWHELADLPFDFRIDQAFAAAMASIATDAGYQAKLVDYEGFPVDTGTIVADRLLNRGRFKTNMVASCVYSDAQDTARLGEIMRLAIESNQGANSVPTAVVGVTTLSANWFTHEIDMREDQIRLPEDDQWNKKILDHFRNGDYISLEKDLPAYTAACKVDMNFKALHFLKGVGALTEPAKVHAYGPVYGTGNAVIEF